MRGGDAVSELPAGACRPTCTGGSMTRCLPTSRLAPAHWHFVFLLLVLPYSWSSCERSETRIMQVHRPADRPTDPLFENFILHIWVIHWKEKVESKAWIDLGLLWLINQVKFLPPPLGLVSGCWPLMLKTLGWWWSNKEGLLFSL